MSERLPLAPRDVAGFSARVDQSHLRFAFKAYRRPFRVPVRTSRGLWEMREGILIRVDRDDGASSFGEIAPLPAFGTETFAAALAWCARLEGKVEIERLRDVPRGHPCCAAAVAGVPLLGERATKDASDSDRSPLRKERDSDEKPKRLAVAALLPTGAPAHDALARAADAGFTVFKMKIGADEFATERSLVERLAARLPKDARLRLDANGGLDTRTAARWLDAAQAWPIEFIEQPLPVGEDRELIAIARDHATSVALDESVRGADDIKRWRDRDWRGVFVIKPALAGAPDELVREIAIAPEQFVFSSALETDVGTAAGLRLAFAAGITRALGYGVGAFFPDDGLGGGLARSWLEENEIAALDAEAVWNRL